MEALAEADMTSDGPRGLMTDREREILLGEAEVTDKYHGVVVTRVRKRINRLVECEIEALENHATLADELRDGVCDTQSDEWTS